MKSVEFPTAEFPQLPRISLPLPDGWLPSHLPGALLGGLLDRGPTAFSPNVLVTHARERDVELATVEAAIDEYVATLADAQAIDRRRITLDDRIWSVLEFAHTVPQVGTVFQIIAATVVANGPVDDVVRITASTTPEGMEEILPLLRDIITGARVAVQQQGVATN